MYDYPNHHQYIISYQLPFHEGKKRQSSGHYGKIESLENNLIMEGYMKYKIAYKS